MQIKGYAIKFVPDGTIRVQPIFWGKRGRSVVFPDREVRGTKIETIMDEIKALGLDVKD